MNLPPNSTITVPHPPPHLRTRRTSPVVQIFRFGVVGVLNTVVDLSVLNILIFLTHTGETGTMFAVYKTFAFACAVLNSYLLNRAWTFRRSTDKHHLIEGAQFLFISLLGAVVNVGTSSYVATYMHPRWGIHTKAWPSFAALVGTAFSLGFNFVGYKFWVFSHRKSSAPVA